MPLPLYRSLFFQHWLANTAYGGVTTTRVKQNRKEDGASTSSGALYCKAVVTPTGGETTWVKHTQNTKSFMSILGSVTRSVEGKKYRRACYRYTGYCNKGLGRHRQTMALQFTIVLNKLPRFDQQLLCNIDRYLHTLCSVVIMWNQYYCHDNTMTIYIDDQFFRESPEQRRIKNKTEINPY